MFGFSFGRDRPAGVTVLVILHVIIGIIAAFTGLLLFVAFALPSSLGGFASFAMSVVGVAASYGFLIVAVGVLWFVFCVFSFVLVFVLWKGYRWGWTMSLVLAWNGLIIGALGLSLGILANALAIAVYGLILIYLFLPSVRFFFGRIQTYPAPPFRYPVPTAGSLNWAQSRYYAGQTNPITLPHPGQALTGRLCPNCRTSAPQNAAFCNLCGTSLM